MTRTRTVGIIWFKLKSLVYLYFHGIHKQWLYNLFAFSPCIRFIPGGREIAKVYERKNNMTTTSSHRERYHWNARHPLGLKKLLSFCESSLRINASIEWQVWNIELISRFRGNVTQQELKFNYLIPKSHIFFENLSKKYILVVHKLQIPQFMDTHSSPPFVVIKKWRFDSVLNGSRDASNAYGKCIDCNGLWTRRTIESHLAWIFLLPTIFYTHNFSIYSHPIFLCLALSKFQMTFVWDGWIVASGARSCALIIGHIYQSRHI